MESEMTEDADIKPTKEERIMGSSEIESFTEIKTKYAGFNHM